VSCPCPRSGLLAAFTRSSAVQLLLACGGALLFSAFIVYDVQLLAGSVGDRQAAVQLSPDEYVVAALQIYLDVVQLFLHLLRLVSEMQRN
jgi:FtsH-binding integral membrane protein